MHARRAYRRIGPAHQRWIDTDDLVQEALVASLEAERSYRKVQLGKNKRQKFSSHLFRATEWKMLSAVQRLTRTASRGAPVVELDAELPGAKQTFAETVSNGDCEKSLTKMNCAAAFLALCRELVRVSEQAVAVVIRGFLFSDARGIPDVKICAEIASAASKVKMSMEDFRAISTDENFRKKLLRMVCEHVMISEGTEEAIRCLECVECGGQFSLGSVRAKTFYPQSMTCRACYRKKQRALPEASCFGKVKQPGTEGYSEADVECRLHCIDRAACKSMLKEENKAMSEVEEELKDVDMGDIDEKAKPKKAKPEASAKAGKSAKKKAAKTAKKSKSKEADYSDWPYDPREDPPKDVVKWPYKNGSTMLYVFMSMYKGCNKAELEKEVSAQFNWKNMLKIMQRHDHREHTWKLNEEGSRFKIFDVKYKGGKAAAKATKAAAKEEKTEKPKSKKKAAA